MKLPLTSIPFLRWCCAALAACSFTACGGGGGDNGGGTTQLLASPGVVTSANGAPLANIFGTVMSGANETPANPSSAAGVGAVIVDPATKVMKGVIIASGLNATAAHIHDGDVGVAGPILFPFTEVAPGSGIFTTTVTLTDAQLARLLAGGYYMNAHSPNFPSGEIRGQLVALQESSAAALAATTGGGTPLAASGTIPSTAGTTATAAPFNTFLDVLSAQQVVPATTSQGAGIALAITDTVNRSVSAAVITQGLAGVTVDLHTGAAGTSGAAVIGLGETLAGSGVWTTKRGVGLNAGPVPALSDAQLAAFVSGSYYADVHTAANPNGEIRGQLLAATTPAATLTTTPTITPTITPTPTSTAPTPVSTMPMPTLTPTPVVTTPLVPAGLVSVGAGVPGY